MNWLDILVFIPLAWFGFKGLKNGLVRELASVAALILGIWVTINFSDKVASLVGDSATVKVIAFVLTFIAVLVIVYFIGMLVEKIIKLVIPGFINNLFGLLFGVCKVLIVFSVFLYFINIVDVKERIIKHNVKENSFFYRYIEKIVPEGKAVFFDTKKKETL